MGGLDAYVYARGMGMTASALRRDIYRILDRVIETGEPVIIERKGRRIRIAAESMPSRLDALVRRPDVVVGDSEDFVHLDWSNEWTDALVAGTALLTKDRTIHDRTTIAGW